MKLSARERQLLTALVVLLTVYVALRVTAELWDAIVRIGEVMLIFIVAWAFSYVLAPLVNRIDETTPLNRAGAVLVVYLGIAIVLAGALALAIPALVVQLTALVQRGPAYGVTAAQTVAQLQDALQGIGIRVDLVEIYGAVPQRLADALAGFAADALGVATATAGLLFNVTLVLIIAFIMLIDGDALWRELTGLLSEELRSEAELLRQSADRSFGGFIRGSLLLGLIYGVATLLILATLGVPFAGVLALVSGVTVIIPFFGPIIAMLTVLAVTLFGAPDKLLWVFILSIALQQAVLNVVGPRILSRSIGIHPLFVFLALLLGSHLAGFWGVLLAMPIAGVINTFLRYLVEIAQGRRVRAQASSLIIDAEAAVADAKEKADRAAQAAAEANAAAARVKESEAAATR